MYAWTQNLSYEEARAQGVQETGQLSDSTNADGYNYCQELMADRYSGLEYGRGMIEKRDSVVQIDEAKSGWKKYHRWRVVEGRWILAMVQDESDDLRLKLCPGNVEGAATLISLI